MILEFLPVELERGNGNLWYSESKGTSNASGWLYVKHNLWKEHGIKTGAIEKKSPPPGKNV